ncbi:MAG TPA: helix-turn-helix transcriptional regulator [Actinophytocola sp.]|jgi:transcriptional regulator with XRE-family HTH domain|nr:helix-turn-helix transcriptional regulator [Actinophytocola sp.]
MTESENGPFQVELTAFGKRVRAVRRYRDITQDQLAKQVRTSRSRLSRIERGHINVTLETVFRLSRALDIHPTVLFDDRIDIGQAPRYEPPPATG